MPFNPLHSVLGGLCVGLSVFHNARLHSLPTNVSASLFRAHSSLASLLAVLGHALSGRLLRPLARDLHALPLLDAAPLPRVAAAGVLVGVGTRLAGGCTSGHGVSGVARASVASVVATSVGIGASVVVATVLQTAGMYGVPANEWEVELPTSAEAAAILGVIVACALAPPLLAAVAKRIADGKGRAREVAGGIARAAVHVAIGTAAGAGLVISGLAAPSKVSAFQTIAPSWDPSLLIPFIGAWPIAAVGLRGLKTAHEPVSKRLVIGALLFGTGGGVLGLCPPAALVYAGAWPGGRGSLLIASMLFGGHAGGFAANALGV